MPDVWVIAAGITKCALYLGVITAAGTAFATMVFRLTQTRGFCLAFAGLGIFAALLGFALQGAQLTGDISGMTDLDMLGLLWGTEVGTALVFCIGGLGVLFFGLWIGPLGLWLAVMGAVVAILSFVQVGHISQIDSLLLDAALALHLSAVALWVGVLTPLSRLTASPQDWPEAAALGRRFGRVAAVTVPLLIVLGGVMGYALVGSIAALVGTSYGIALLIKVGLVAGLLGLAAANKLRFVPGLEAQDHRAAKYLVWSIRAEWVLFIAVLAVTAALTSGLTLPT